MNIGYLKKFNYIELLKDKNKINESYPFVGVNTIGKSVMGRDIYSLTLGAAEEYVLFLGGLHGSDHFTCGLLLAFFEELCKGVLENTSIEGLKVRSALKGRAVIVIPCVNPDSCEIASLGKSGCGNQADKIQELSKGNLKNYCLNARGVDIDLNFCGRNSLSEPESWAIASLCKETSVRHAIVFGSGNKEIITPGGEKIPARSNRMSEIMTTATGYGISFNRNDPRREGFVQWFCEEFFHPAFKVLPRVPDNMSESDYIKVYKELRELMMLCAIM